jgi:hypothetical protein
MNVKLGYTTPLTAGVWWDNHLLMANYSITFKLITITDDARDSNTALDRLKYMIEEVFTDAVFVSSKESDQIKKLKAAGIKTIIMPEEPVDQIIGMMLYSKIGAVMDGNIGVRSVMISSNIGDDVIYEHDQSESMEPFDSPGWWADSSPGVEDEVRKKSKDQVFVITPSRQWYDLGLAWDSEQVESDNENVLVFTDFKNDKDK